jgi:hypothetical protein
MMKTFLSRHVWGEILLTVVFYCLFTLSALAQNSSSTIQISPGATAATTTPAKGIGPAPANSKQHQILTSALSPQTRQTLQEAMNSVHTTDTPPPAK